MTDLVALPCTGSAQVVGFFNDKLSTLPSELHFCGEWSLPVE